MSKLELDSKKSTRLNIRQRRVFSEEFKREKVQGSNTGLYSIGSFCKLWDATSPVDYRWIYLHSPEHKKGTTMVVQKDSEAQRTNDLLNQVAELERYLGQEQMQIDYLEKLVELASKECDIDFKKNQRTTLEYFRVHIKRYSYLMKDLFKFCNISRQAHHQALIREQKWADIKYLIMGLILQTREVLQSRTTSDFSVTFLY